MARNVEIKARVGDVDCTRRLVERIADRGPEKLVQVDTFFNVQVGRLKLREVSETDAEFIHYLRSDAPWPTESHYERMPVSHPLALRELLAAALGVCGRVQKDRLVYWVGRTRVHLDMVRDLGNFLELEVVLETEEPVAVGVREAERLMDLFDIHEDSLLSDAYVDLLHGEGRLIQA